MGLLFVKTLIEMKGVDAFFKYYSQAPEGEGKDLFKRNYEAYWGTSLDEDWKIVTKKNYGSDGVKTKLSICFPLCACNQPSLPAFKTEVAYEPLRHPYWRLPDVGNRTISLDSAKELLVADCSQRITRVHTYGRVLAKVGDGHFVKYLQGEISVGNYLADECDEVDELEYPLEDRYQMGLVTRPTWPDAMVIFLKVKIPTAGSLIVYSDSEDVTLCPTCQGMDGPGCTPIPSSSDPIVVSEGSVYLRLRFPANKDQISTESSLLFWRTSTDAGVD